MTTTAVSDLTQATIDGTGIFDVLMRANAAHLEAEFSKGRIKGAEYSTVYLGSLTQVMQTALAFLGQRQVLDLQAQLLQEQIAQTQQQTANLINQDLQVVAQIGLVTQQKANLLNDAVTALHQRAKIDQEIRNLAVQATQVEAQTSMVQQQTQNTAAEINNIAKQGAVLVATECKLRADFDLIKSTDIKTAQESVLLAQKAATERAQIMALGVDVDSVIGRQKQVYLAQSNGYARDAEQKAAKVMVDTWNVRRTTDADSAPADTLNRLDDESVGKVVARLMDGVGAMNPTA